MNYSILYLSSVLHFSSPFLSIPQNLIHFNLFQYNVYFQQSFTHFLFCQTGFANFQMENSRFKSFLSSPIKINSNNFTNEYFYKESLLYKKDVNLKLHGNVFESCSSLSVGGAIQIFAVPHGNSSLSITDCFFDKCCAMIQGGAIFALVSQYAIQTSCFKHCWSRDKQVANLKSESYVMHSINFTAICLNGIQSNLKDDDDLNPKNSMQTTFTSYSTDISIVNINSTKNVVSENCACNHIISTSMAYLKFSTFSDNLGEKALHFSLKNQSSIEYINMINNSAYLKYKALIFCSARASFMHLVFINNMYPLVRSSRQGRVWIIDCIFDFNEKQIIDGESINENIQNSNNAFNGNISYTNCVFDKKLAKPNEFPELLPELCINKFDTSENKFISYWYFYVLCLAILFLLIISFLILRFYKPLTRYISKMKHKKEVEREERLPFIDKKNNRFI